MANLSTVLAVTLLMFMYGDWTVARMPGPDF
jgi:hypothetical protein